MECEEGGGTFIVFPPNETVDSGLANGSIEIWDYGLQILVERLEDQIGAVRAVHFHGSSSIFASGGDDKTVKLWKYAPLREIDYILLRHDDRVNSVQFHHDLPWIVSASSDNYICIWNWKLKSLIAEFGHDASVMSAYFHPKEDLLVVSASVDRTIRIWNVESLKEENNGVVGFLPQATLQGHAGAVNCAIFHLKISCIYSGSDDHDVRMWSRNGMGIWQSVTLQGHSDKISSVVYHPKYASFFSASTDKSIRLWDNNSLTLRQKITHKEADFCALAVHPRLNMLAAGHARGLIVFKVERERPPFALAGDHLFYCKDKNLCCYEFSTKLDFQVLSLKCLAVSLSLKTLSYSPTGKAAVICLDSNDGMRGSYELYIIPKDSHFYRKINLQTPENGNGDYAVFISDNRFAVLDKDANTVAVKDLSNHVVRSMSLEATAIFSAGIGSLLCSFKDHAALYSLQEEKQAVLLGALKTPSFKHVVWSSDMESVALLCKDSIIGASKELILKFRLDEPMHVKSGAWDENGVFIYSTVNRINYCLLNGESGIIRMLEVPCYITKIYGDKFYYLDPDGTIRYFPLDAAEYKFKLALLRNDYSLAMSMINTSQIYGQAVIDYLLQKGFPEIALRLAASATTNIGKDQLTRIGRLALRKETKDFESLSSLYQITGNLDKLSELMKSAEVKDDLTLQFQNALFRGDVKERVKILEKTGHLSLAYVTASVHGLNDIAARLSTILEDNVPSLPEGKTPLLLIPPPPVICCGDWPLLRENRGGDVDGMETLTQVLPVSQISFAADGMKTPTQIVPVSQISFAADKAAAGNRGGDVDGTETLTQAVPASQISFAADKAAAGNDVTEGAPVSQIWSSSSFAAEQAAAGNFDTAMHLLDIQLGIKNFEPLKSMLLDLFRGSHSYPGGLPVAIEREWSKSSSPNVHGPPRLVFDFSKLDKMLSDGYNATTAEKYGEALRVFLSILHTIPLVVVESRRKADEVKQLITTAKEYVLGLKMELRRKEMNDDPVREQELSAYLTHFKLQDAHIQIALHSAMSLCNSSNNHGTAYNFGTRLLATNPEMMVASVARYMMELAELNELSDETELNYDPAQPFVICGSTYVPIYEGADYVSCPYCGARFVPIMDGNTCSV